MDNQKVIDQLNHMLEQEHEAAICQVTHTALVKGPYAEVIAARLAEIASDDIEQAKKLRERITSVGRSLA